MDITIKILLKIPVAVIHTRYDLLKKGSGFTFSALPMLNCIIKKMRLQHDNKYQSIQNKGKGRLG